MDKINNNSEYINDFDEDIEITYDNDNDNMSITCIVDEIENDEIEKFDNDDIDYFNENNIESINFYNDLHDIISKFKKMELESD